MPKKLTITVDSEVYDGLHAVIGPRRISRFLNVTFRDVIGSEVKKTRQAVVISNDTANRFLDRVQVVPYRAK